MPRHARATCVHVLIQDAPPGGRGCALRHIMSLIFDAEVAPPAHATWHVRRVSSPPAFQALTWRIGAPARPCNVRACPHPGRSSRGAGVRGTYMMSLIFDAEVAPPADATWHVRRVSSPPAFQAPSWRFALLLLHGVDVRLISDGTLGQRPEAHKSGLTPTYRSRTLGPTPRMRARPTRLRTQGGPTP